MREETKNRFIEFCKKEHFDISNPDSKQREAVFSDDKFIIPAGAGSGKTTVLTYRFLRLLIDEDIAPIHSDEILTMTFTKAATANMKGRIYKALKVAEKEGLVKSEEIERFSNAEICTTDSFCSKIVRLDSIRYGLTPDFRIEDDDDYNKWADLTCRKIILDNISNVEVNNLVSWHGNERITEALKTIGKNYFSFPTSLPENLGETLRTNYDNRLTEEIEKQREKLSSLLSSFISSFQGYSKAEDDIKAAKEYQSALQEDLEITSLPSFSGKRKIDKDEATNKKFTETRKSIKEEAKALLTLFYYNSTPNNLEGWSIILSSFYKELWKHKREDGILIFKDVMLIALDILKTNKELRSYFSSRFKRIMVDEFQDNNSDNKKLIYLLASTDSYSGENDPTIQDIDIRKIFMVGDEKQSIYRFRGADVSVFKNISKDFGEDRVLSLSQNFRSEESVINRINRMFQNNIMSPEPKEDYEARYKPLISNVHKVSSSQMKFLWLDWKSAKKKSDKKYMTDANLTEAYWVAYYIKNEIMENGDKWPIAKGRDGGERKPKYSDIAILLRKGTHQSDFEKALRHFGIPFNVSDNKSLTMDAVVNDFYNALSLTLYGYEDEISFTSYLRSPFASLTDEGIATVLENKREKRPLDFNLSAEDTISFNFAEETIEGAKEIAKKGRITPILSYLWIDRGYRYFIEGKEANRVYSEHYDYLFALSSSFDSSGKTIVDLLDRIRPLLGIESNLKDISVQEESVDGVTIQTIHKSKGLEYPIVFVSDTGGSIKGNSSLKITPDDSLYPTIPFIVDPKEEKLLNPWEDFKNSNEAELENAEIKRLLYVAATRAEHHIVFSGSFDNEGDPDSTLTKKNLLYYIAKGLGFSFQYNVQKERESYSCSFLDIDGLGKEWAFEEKEIFPIPLSTFSERKEKGKKSLPDDEWYENPEVKKEFKLTEKFGVTTIIEEENFSSLLLPSSLFINKKEGKGVFLPTLEVDEILSDTSRLEDKTEDELKEIKGERITEFGTLVHKTLEDRILGQEGDYSSFFKDDKKRNKIVESALALRDAFFSSSYYNETLSSFSLTPERSFMVMDGERMVEGIIDLFCEKDDEIFIVDYKTDSYRLEAEHKNQLNYYREALKTIYPDKKIRAAVFYLRAPEDVLMIN